MGRKIYIAAPVVGITDEQSEQIKKLAHYAKFILLCGKNEANDVYCPWNLKIPNAWNMPQDQWARCVFTQDVFALDRSEIVIVCDYGRFATAGTAWEAGYAFAKEKKILHILMPGVKTTSLMVHNGCTVTVNYDDFVQNEWTWPNYREIQNTVTQD